MKTEQKIYEAENIEKELNDGLAVVELEERLEMVQAAEDPIVISCCLD